MCTYVYTYGNIYMCEYIIFSGQVNVYGTSVSYLYIGDNNSTYLIVVSIKQVNTEEQLEYAFCILSIL